MEKITVNKKVSITLYTPKELKAHLDEYIIGQDEAKRTISTAIYNHYKRLVIKDSSIVTKVDKSNVILAGPSGCGKTAIIKCIADYMGVPYYIADATTMTQAGYVGDDVETCLSGLLAACDYDKEKAECGIVFIDEIDKIAKHGRGAHTTGDPVGEGVQQSLLKIVEGHSVGVLPFGKRKNPEQPLEYIDTTDILFVASGAFPGMEDIIRERVAPEQDLGFHVTARKVEDMDENEIFSYMSTEDLKEFGFIPEFIGRFPVIANVRQLTTDELVRIMTEPNNSIVDQYATLLALDDISFTIERPAIERIAQLAIKLKTGARSIRSIFENVMGDYMFELPGSGVHEFTLTEDIVREKVGKRYSTLLEDE